MSFWPSICRLELLCTRSWAMDPPRVNGSSYDVFLSFRGEDTRYSFTDHLYHALKKAGISTFRDSDDAERGPYQGEYLDLEIKRKIEASDASIIVLSENYATSTWCLDELSLILVQRRRIDRKHYVLPLFYHVDPSDVGKHRGTFMLAAGPSRRWTDENVNRWKEAVTEVVGVIGECVTGPETEFIKKVVDIIYRRKDRNEINIPENATGINVRYDKIFNSWLKESKEEFLVISGMPGSGKSTLAQYIVFSCGEKYESTSIVEKIGERCSKNPREMVILQQQLRNDISKGMDRRKIHNVSRGTPQIEVLLKTTKALIVLDDIVNEHQLRELLGSGIVNPKSKIIITTDNAITGCLFFKSKRYQKYKMELLDDDESLKLFCLHAFGSDIPKDGYESLAQKVIRYCEGNPLSLEVLGSSLSQKDTMAKWETELRSLEKDLHKDIRGVLERNYNSLTDFEKDVFLHIACFFVGIDMEYVVNVLEPDYAAISKIETLIKRCFLYVTPDKKLMMHGLLQEMGRSIVDRVSRIPAERSRVWCNKDSYEILGRNRSAMTVEGLALDVKMLKREKEFENRNLSPLSSDSLQQMDRLKFLKLNYAELTGSYEDASEHLRWLSWVGFSEKTIHSDLFMGKLVALDMSYSCLKEFEPPTFLGSLKILNLKDSHDLFEIRNIDQIPNLETLILWNCKSLFSVCRKIGNLEKLSLLNMTGCKKLVNREQEPSFPLPRFLQRLFLDKCNIRRTDYFPLCFNDQKALQYINLGNVEGLFKLLPVAILDEAELGHMNWLKEYQDYKVCLVGDHDLTEGRSCYLQMLYEYNIRSTSLPDLEHPNLVPEYTSQSTCVSFDVPCCPIGRRLLGLNVIVRYKLSGEDWACKPVSGEVCVWLSYWPIGNLLDVGDEVTVSIVVTRGLEVFECGASLVYNDDDDEAREICENKLGCAETVGRDLTGFQLSNGSYYLCRRDFYKSMEVGRLNPGWLSGIVGDIIDDTEVRGWRMAGRPRQLYQSFTELKSVRCIIHYPETCLTSISLTEYNLRRKKRAAKRSEIDTAGDAKSYKIGRNTDMDDNGYFIHGY
ncbi:disease resistance protein RPV1-like [Rutidosis leptorrhynchoides]|uniref:disease resistance protein RPV1-like n=1 Tax=Rutidosis leptorrhynchoides TaxID=125765 RepID=UPI003A9A0CBF